MAVTVRPSTFTLVNFDAAEITGIAERLRDEVGLPGQLDITIDVDERSPTGRVAVTSTDPLQVSIEGGAFEDPKRPRTLSEANTVDVLGLVFYQTNDRRDPEFGAPEADADLSLAHRVAWDVLAMGRLERLGHPAQRPRWLYHFRNRHGFTDASDAAFDQVWAGRVHSWAELVGLSDAARAVRTA